MSSSISFKQFRECFLYKITLVSPCSERSPITHLTAQPPLAASKVCVSKQRKVTLSTCAVLEVILCLQAITQENKNKN